ncbi:hypothetical protein LEN26_001637 [Aphanomyces euteiches]|nr:hypothetical protein AeMF1_010863 [Aphanomyces euteiches]KAH9160964.1 hypothetical protein LEN26_001637 [Aphanomyces euteiches]KAH9183154.1 hypothetical protein AeNC1_014871 [Aphanomyces euteiches]
MKPLPLVALLFPLVLGSPCTNQEMPTLQSVLSTNLSRECTTYSGCNNVACIIQSFHVIKLGNICWSSACRRDLDTAATAAFPSCDEAKASLAVINGIRGVCASDKFGSTLPLCDAKVDYRSIPLGPKCQAVAPSSTTALFDFIDLIMHSSQAYCASTGAAKDCMDELLSSTIPKMPVCQDAFTYWNIGDYISAFLTGFCAGPPTTLSASLTNCVAQLSPFLAYPISTACNSVFGSYKSFFGSHNYHSLSEIILLGDPSTFAQLCSQTSCIQDMNAAVALLPTAACRSIVASDVKAIQSYCAFNMTSTAAQPNCSAQMLTLEDTILRSTPDSSCNSSSSSLEDVVAPGSVRYFDKFCSQKACVDASISTVATMPNCQMSGLSLPALYGGAFSSICKTLYPPPPATSSPFNATPTVTQTPSTSNATPTPTKSHGNQEHLESFLVGFTLVATAILM